MILHQTKTPDTKKTLELILPEHQHTGIQQSRSVKDYSMNILNQSKVFKENNTVNDNLAVKCLRCIAVNNKNYYY